MTEDIRTSVTICSFKHSGVTSLFFHKVDVYVKIQPNTYFQSRIKLDAELNDIIIITQYTWDNMNDGRG